MPSFAFQFVEKRMKEARDKEASSVVEEGAIKSPAKDRAASLGEDRPA